MYICTIETQFKMENKKKHKSLVILKSTLSRLPLYYYYVEDKKRIGQRYVSSSAIAEALTLNPVQVRKDLASVSSIPGRSKLGFETARLLEDIKSYLGYDNFEEAVIVGVGGLGRTLMSYAGFAHYGIDIVAGFDINPSLDGVVVASKPVFALDKLPDIVQRLGIRLGIIAVPAPQAQSVVDLMTLSGIRAIWNFAPTLVTVPEGVIIKNENLAASLAVLAMQLNRNED